MNGPWSLIRSARGALALALAAVLGSCSNDGGNETPASADPKEIALVRVEPSDGESSVPRNQPVRLIFSELLLPESVDDQSIRIRTGGTFQTRPEGSFLVSGNVVEFDPTVAQSGGQNAIGFPAGAQVLVEVPLFVPQGGEPKENFVQNVEGNPITAASGDNIISFTTGFGWLDPVPGPPGVLGLEFVPGPNALGQVPPTAAVTVVFSEPIDPSSITLGDNIFMTNNTSTSPTFEQGIPSNTYYDGSLTRFTFLPVFGFGQGPFNIKVNFIDPADPQSFDFNNLPQDLGGNRVNTFTFVETFDTQFDPSLVNTGLITEEFNSVAKRDPANTDAVWSDDSQIPFALVSQPITTRLQRVNITAMLNLGGAFTDIPDCPGPGPGVNPLCPPGYSLPNNPPNEGKFCPTVNPLVGGNLTLPNTAPPLSDGRRRLNLYRSAELGPDGTILRVSWGPDSDALFASTYGRVIVRLGHKRAGTNLAGGSFFDQYDVDGYVQVADVNDYKVIQAADVNGGLKNDGYYDWPALDQFFDYNGDDDLILDVEATVGTTWQQFRTFFGVSQVPGWGTLCNCVTVYQGACNANASMGLRQTDGVFGGDTQNPGNPPGVQQNPGPFVDVMQFEMAKLRSVAQSTYYDTLTDDPDYLAPILQPLVQPGGATVTFTWSGSVDGVADGLRNGAATVPAPEELTFVPNINAIDGFRFIRWRAVLRSNIFTGARARILQMDIPFTFDTP